MAARGGAQTAEFAAYLDATNVDKSLQNVDKNVSTLRGKLGGLVSAFMDVEQKGARRSAQALMAVGHAASGAGGEMARLLGTSMNVVQAFASGGPFVGAMALAGAAAVEFTKYLDELIRKQNEAIDLQFAATDNASALLRKARDDVETLRDQLSGATAVQRAYAGVQKEIDAVRAKLDAMRQSGKMWTDNERAAAKMLETTLATLEQKQNLAAAVAAKGSGGSKSGGVAAAGGGAGPGGGRWAFMRATMMEANEAMAAEAAELDAEIAEDRWQAGLKEAQRHADLEARMHEMRTAMARDAAQEQVRITKEAEEQRLRIIEDKAQQELAARTAAYGTALAIGTGAAQQLATAIISQQDRAVEHALARIAMEAGSAMIGHGINAAAGGLAMLSLGNPAGGVAVATGAGLIAGGLTIGGVGTGIEASLTGGKAGGRGPRVDSERAFAEPRTRTRAGGGGRGGGGGVTIIHNWGVASPTAEDSARATRDLLELGRRRRLIE